jgi:hypothetical protein
LGIDSDPSLAKEVLKLRVQMGNAGLLSCRHFPSRLSRSGLSNTLHAVSRDVARARECPDVRKCTRLVPAMNRNLAIADNITALFAGLLPKPSDGLEPSTPSLPWRIALRVTWAGIPLAKPFPCNLPYSGAKPHLPRRPLRRPQKARTCPQNPSPTAPRVSPWTRASGGRDARSRRVQLFQRRESKYGEIRCRRSSRSATGTYERTMIG